jgi:hypothetical protein
MVQRDQQGYSERKAVWQNAPYEREHVDELALSAKIPDGEGDLGIADRDGLFHKVDAERLNVIFVEAAFDVADHQTCLANL